MPASQRSGFMESILGSPGHEFIVLQQQLQFVFVDLGPVFSYESASRERIRIKRGTRFYRGFPNQLLTDSWAVGSRRADRWNALGYTTTNGIGSRMFCPGVRGMWAAPRTIIDCSSKPFSTDLERAVPGVICPRVSATSRRSINVSADGRKVGFSSVFSSC